MPLRTDLKRLLAALVILSPLTAQALPEDAKQPIHVTANSAHLDQKTGEAIYQGNVVVTQGTMRMTGDTLKLYVNDKGELQTGHTYGKPARYQQKTDPNKGPVNSESSEIQFDNTTGIITLIGNAILHQDGSTFTGPKIAYSTLRKQVEASSDANQRVHLVFPPSATKGSKTGSASPAGSATAAPATTTGGAGAASTTTNSTTSSGGQP